MIKIFLISVVHFGHIHKWVFYFQNLFNKLTITTSLFKKLLIEQTDYGFGQFKDCKNAVFSIRTLLSIKTKPRDIKDF